MWKGEAVLGHGFFNLLVYGFSDEKFGSVGQKKEKKYLTRYV